MTNTMKAPPPLIDDAYLLAYLKIDSAALRVAKPSLKVDGKPVRGVRGLAIGRSLNDSSVLLFFCDQKWSSLGVVGCSTVIDAKRQAHADYPGNLKKWIKATVTKRQALAYREKQSGGMRCSFCSRSPDDVSQLFEVSNVRICDHCVRDFHNQL
jgi:hypothetical protein